MSRTYKYPREALDDIIARNEFDANRRIQKKLDRQKHRKKIRRHTALSFKKLISYRDKQRSRG